jgi:protein-tyrosine-phosphatase
MKTYNILFLCTHNSARSILGEAIASTDVSGKLIGYSAGSTPGTSVNPIAKKIAIKLGYDAKKLYSKSWDEFAKSESPQMDFIITVCDNAAKEVCPVWVGHPATAHWGFPDPSETLGSEAEKEKAFNEVAMGLTRRIQLLTSLPIDKLDHLSLTSKLKEIHSNASKK